MARIASSLVFALLVLVFGAWCENALATQENEDNKIEIPGLCSNFGSYPNPLGITEDDRASFHPVIKFPIVWQEEEVVADNNKGSASRHRIKVPNVSVSDHTRPSERPQLATEDEILTREQELQSLPRWQQKMRQLPMLSAVFPSKFFTKKSKKSNNYSIGRYDENRIGMYSSEMFQDTENSIGGYSGARTVHVGIDLAAQVGTKVYALTDGIVHSAGYNPERGDYGNVIVIEHTVPSNGRKFYALYGHLDGNSIKGKEAGQRVQKGQVIGWLGDIHENGGWHAPHVHFQLSTESPETHDMPGAVALEDRPKALFQYPDPRWVLGMLY